MSFGGPRMAMRAPGGAPAERAKDLRGTLRRLLARLRPERLPLAAALMLGVTSVAFMVTGPRILGNATNVLFNGVVGKLLPAGTTKAQAIATLRAHGQAQIMVSGMNVTPGKGVDLGELGRALGAGGARLPPGCRLQLRPGIRDGGRHPAHDVRAPPRGRGEAQPVAAALDLGIKPEVGDQLAVGEKP